MMSIERVDQMIAHCQHLNREDGRQFLLEQFHLAEMAERFRAAQIAANMAEHKRKVAREIAIAQAQPGLETTMLHAEGAASACEAVRLLIEQP